MTDEIIIRQIENAWILKYRRVITYVEESCGTFEDATTRMEELLDVEYVEKGWFG